jgi:NitT/TauT family transport system substrate-binding protein
MKGNSEKSGKSIKCFVIVIVLSTVATLFLGNLGSAVQAKELMEVPFRLSWLMEVGDNGSYFLALDRGYYAKEGIDIKILAGKGSSSTVKIVGSSDAPIFAFGHYIAMAIAINQGVPLKGIFGMIQEDPSAVISLADKPIKTVKDLIGKKFAVAAQSYQEMMFYAVLKANNIKRDQVEIIHVPFNMANTLLLERKADAMLQWFTTNVPILESQGAKVYYLKYADMGVKAMASGIMTNQKTIDKYPDIVKKFLRATARGIKEAKDDPEAAIAALVKYNPRAAGTEKSMLENLKLIQLTYTTNKLKEKPIGFIDHESFEDTLDLVLQLEWIDKKLPHEKYYTNEFNPGIMWK